MDAQIDEFCSITGQDREVAQSFLDMTTWDLREAVRLFYSMRSGEFTQQQQASNHWEHRQFSSIEGPADPIAVQPSADTDTDTDKEVGDQYIKREEEEAEAADDGETTTYNDATDYTYNGYDDDDNSDNCTSFGSPGGKMCLVILVVLGFLFGLAVIAGIIVAIMHEGVERGHWALKENKHTGSVDSTTVYEPGLYYWGFTYTPLQFPRAPQNVTFTGKQELQVPTDQGTIVGLGVHFDYFLRKDGVGQLYRSFGHSYKEKIIQISRAALKNGAPQFDFSQFSQQRKAVEAGLHGVLVNALRNSSVPVDVPFTHFFIRKVTLPSDVETRKVNIFLEAQRKVTAVSEEQAALVRLDTTANVTSIDGATSVVASTAKSQGSRMVLSARSSATSFLQQETGVLLANMVTALGLENSTDAVVAEFLEINGLLDIMLSRAASDQALAARLRLLHDAGYMLTELLNSPASAVGNTTTTTGGGGGGAAPPSTNSTTTTSSNSNTSSSSASSNRQLDETEREDEEEEEEEKADDVSKDGDL